MNVSAAEPGVRRMVYDSTASGGGSGADVDVVVMFEGVMRRTFSLG